MLRRRTLIQGLLATVATPALAQNSFLTPGGSSVPGIVTMCLSSNVAVPCATGGGGSFPPNISGTQATIAADFAGQQYWASAASQASFAAWMTAIGGTYTRASSATYLQGGVVKTAAANTPRFPTDLGGTAQGIRLTGSATNIAVPSNDFTNAAWSVQLVTIAPTATAGPDGVAGSAASIVPNATLGTHLTYTGSIGTVSSGSLCASVFLKPNGYNFGFVGIKGSSGGQYGVIADLSTGAITSTNIINGGTGTSSGAIKLAGGWVLVWAVVATSGAGGAAMFVGASDVAVPTWDAAWDAPSFSGNGTSGVYIFGAQTTNTPFPCDYIPTTTATVTQAADSLSFPFTQTTFSVLVGTNILLNDGSGGQRVVALNASIAPIFINNSTSFATFGNVIFLTGPAITDVINPHKSMMVTNNTNVWLTSDGLVPVTAAGAFLAAAPSNLSLGNASGTSYANGNYPQLAVWNGVVASTVEMQRLTT